MSAEKELKKQTNKPGHGKFFTLFSFERPTILLRAWAENEIKTTDLQVKSTFCESYMTQNMWTPDYYTHIQLLNI